MCHPVLSLFQLQDSHDRGIIHPVDKMSLKEVVLLFLSLPFPDRPFLKEMGPEAEGKLPKREGSTYRVTILLDKNIPLT